MPNVISNTSCLSALYDIGRLELLEKRYGKIIITPEVAGEYGEELPDWISIVKVKDVSKTLLIAQSLDIGEASTIALAYEFDDPLVILDDGKARKYANNINLKMTGTLGFLIKAYETGLMKNFSEVIADLKSVRFYMPHDFEETLIERGIF
jgi:predicted nucleic acid-binding protein